MFEFLKRFFKGKDKSASSSGPDPVAVYAVTSNGGKNQEEKPRDPDAKWDTSQGDTAESDGDFDA